MTDTRAAFEAWFCAGPAPVPTPFEIWQAAIKHEREQCAKVCEDVDEPGWTGYECPNTFNDGKWAAAAAVRARNQP